MADVTTRDKMTGLLFSILPGPLQMANSVAARLVSLAEEGSLKLVVSQKTPFTGASSIVLPDVSISVPKTPTAAWREASQPLADAIDGLDSIEVIFVSDLASLRVLTAARVPKAPIIWLGELAALEAAKPSLYEACALRLTTGLWFFDAASEQRVWELCEWQNSPHETLPTILSSPEAGFETVKQLLTVRNPLLPAQLESALRANVHPFLGKGSRRACYRIENTDYCIKHYHRPETIPDSQASVVTVRKEVRAFAHSRAKNTSCQEHDYLQALIREKPQEIVAAFPDVVNLIYLPYYGWSLLETFIANVDNTPAELVVEYLGSCRAEPARYNATLRQLDQFVNLFITYAVAFYDIRNILVQKDASGKIRFRVADFEPQNRQIITFFMKIPFFIRSKIRRRYNRTLTQNRLSPI